MGARSANDHPAAAAWSRWIVVGEPTDNKVATGSKGSLRLRLTAAGTGGHSAYPDRGRSAIHTLLDVLADLRRVAWPSDPVFGATTCNIGIVSGGTGANVLAPDAGADIQLRVATDDASVRALVEQVVAWASRGGMVERHPPDPARQRPGVRGVHRELHDGCAPPAELGQGRPTAWDRVRFTTRTCRENGSPKPSSRAASSST